MQPHRRQPTGLPHPWDSPGKNTGVGCHFLLQCMKVKSESEVAQLCPTLSDPMDCSLPGSSVQGIFQARVLEWGAIAFSILTHIVYFIKSLQTGVIFLWDYETLLTILYWDNQNSTSLFYQLTSNQENRSHLEYFKQKLKQEIGYTDAAIGARLIKKW